MWQGYFLLMSLRKFVEQKEHNIIYRVSFPCTPSLRAWLGNTPKSTPFGFFSLFSRNTLSSKWKRYPNCCRENWINRVFSWLGAWRITVPTAKHSTVVCLCLKGCHNMEHKVRRCGNFFFREVLSTSSITTGWDGLPWICCRLIDFLPWEK